MDISVVIPIYNVEKKLRRYLDSMLHQVDVTKKIILVQDGATELLDKQFTIIENKLSDKSY